MTEFGDALIDDPILNSLYFEPARHWPFDEELGVSGPRCRTLLTSTRTLRVV